VASASERLLVMSNNCIFLVSMSSLEPVGSQLSGVNVICVNENPVDIDDPFAIQVYNFFSFLTVFQINKKK